MGHGFENYKAALQFWEQRWGRFEGYLRGLLAQCAPEISALLQRPRFGEICPDSTLRSSGVRPDASMSVAARGEIISRLTAFPSAFPS